MSELKVKVTKHDHIQGSIDAPCSLVEYGDYECPSCGAVQPVIKGLQARFGTQLSFVFRNFPLQEIHPWAGPAAQFAEWAGTQGVFWEMHDLLFANQDRLSEATFRALCKQLGLADSELRLVALSQTSKDKVDADFAGGIRSGVNGTPTFFLNGERYDGPVDLESLAALLNQVLISNGD